MLLQTGKYILAKIAIIWSTSHWNAAGTSLDRKSVKAQMSFAPKQMFSGLRGAIGQRVRLLSPNGLVTERLVVQAHPGTTIFPVFSYLIFFFGHKAKWVLFRKLAALFFFRKIWPQILMTRLKGYNVQGAGTLFQSTTNEFLL